MECILTLPKITEPFVLLDDNQQQADGKTYLFHSPERIICARTFEEARLAFDDIDAAVTEGFYVAGWVAYECAALFELRIQNVIKSLPKEPLVWMMVTRSRDTLDADAVKRLLDSAENAEPGRMSFAHKQAHKDAYLKNIASIKDYIDAGDVYQVNYTFPISCCYGGSLLSVYKSLRSAQPVAYGAYINTGQETIMSLSPELFIKRSGDILEAKPMKGTAARDADTRKDKQAAEQLVADTKSQAENLMIVDLIRNDLSRIAKIGTVTVDDLFAVETFPSLHQMTSTVHAQCNDTMTPSALFAALFPCGSVTGAPKIRAMEIIAELEQGARGVYCGAVGHFSPASQREQVNWCFNVPIRTMVMNHDCGDALSSEPNISGRLTVGSGVVADSNAQAEFQECLLKADFADAVAMQAPFQLIETMRAEHGQVNMLSLHMDRLSRSAAALGFVCDRTHVETAITAYLGNITDELNSQAALRIRLLLEPDGSIRFSSGVLGEVSESESLKVCFALEAIYAADSMRRHKTTVRSIYDQATIWAQANGYADVLFLNDDGGLAEGAISNIFIENEGTLYTPPLSSGALPGVLREALLRDSSRKIEERVLSPEDILNAEHVYLGNALRGLRKVIVVPTYTKLI